MLWHRVSTLFHYIAYINIADEQKYAKNNQEYKKKIKENNKLNTKQMILLDSDGDSDNDPKPEDDDCQDPDFKDYCVLDATNSTKKKSKKKLSSGNNQQRVSKRRSGANFLSNVTQDTELSVLPSVHSSAYESPQARTYRELKEDIVEKQKEFEAQMDSSRASTDFSNPYEPGNFDSLYERGRSTIDDYSDAPSTPFSQIGQGGRRNVSPAIPKENGFVFPKVEENDFSSSYT
ncbi:Oidioi.mRNA.OKI2018_I69.PAR.g10251.t1.cds [Oikopleura dioica]|uniref:Oidioi.mRNA.OKI2018_I69.PAR.g10251.t1.cds n=1 Tax=Oikopleura dioica TaxID=34765 RepID=A0ABN7RQ02_OIKDI|nr:Oidioi.mRNA.OKI2018_I69.PAR.g10251.t1.cds [Oikopleura dioica]